MNKDMQKATLDEAGSDQLPLIRISLMISRKYSNNENSYNDA